jgi:F-type H+-transporting ATPase subunit epsilon
MAKTFHLTIAKIGENLFDGEAVSVTVPGAEGVLTVLANHEAFVTPLKAGTIRVVTENEGSHTFELAGNGILEVSHSQATVIL